MLRGPTYDDSYITRKLSHMPGPTFSAPPPRGYLQPRKKKKEERERRSLSPNIPWLWPDSELYGKGWYRVDFGPLHGTQLCYLPTFRQRYNFLQSYAEGSPPPAKADTRPRSSSSHRATGRLRVSRPAALSASVRPRSSSYTYYPSLGPYSGRVWRTWTLYPVSGRARSRSLSPPPIRVSTSWTGYQYPPMAPAPPPPHRHLHHRLPPSYYDYDGYGGYGGYGGYYGYAPPPVRMSRYDTYLDDDLPEPSYLNRYRPRVSDVLDDIDYRDKSLPPTTTTTTTDHIRNYSPGAAVVPIGEGRSRPRSAALLSNDLEVERQPQHLLSHRYQGISEPQMLHDHVDKMRIRLKSLAYSLDPTGPVPEIIVPDRPKKATALDEKKYSSGPQHPACEQSAGGRQPVWRRRALARLPPDDQVQLRPDLAELVDPKPDPALEFTELPKLASRRQRYYPEDQHMKDNLRIQCLSHYKTTRTAAEKEKEKLIIKDRLSNRIHQFFNSTMNAERFQKYLKTYRVPGPKPRNAQLRAVMPESSRYSKFSSTKWEEPDTVFGTSDRKPFSKVETGSSFYSTSGITNRKKDYVAEKVRDYYYFGDSAKNEGGSSAEEKKQVVAQDTGRVHFHGSVLKAVTDGTTDEASEEKKERRKKKKSKERDIVGETVLPAPSAAISDVPAQEVEAVSAPSESESVPASAEVLADEELDEKERKRLEKKKRKAEREAAAKAAMEAELAALAAAEAELARLESESSALKPEGQTSDEAPAAPDAPADIAPVPTEPADPPADPAAEVKSESAAEKSE